MILTRLINRITDWRQHHGFPHQPAPIDHCDWHPDNTAVWMIPNRWGPGIDAYYCADHIITKYPDRQRIKGR